MSSLGVRPHLLARRLRVRSLRGMVSLPNSVPMEAPLAERAQQSAAALMMALEKQVVGQKQVKEALILSLVSREHLYIEGPPGIGKTALAEAAVRATGRSSFFAQLHRDTRLSELIGDAVIRRERADNDGGEVIRSDVRAGALLTAEVAVLDDISRAPGEALNVLLRLLNERKYHERPIPLWSAVATGNPTSAEFYNEPLDPATLDRFTLQIKTEGLVASGEWGDAQAVVDAFGDSPFCTWMGDVPQAAPSRATGSAMSSGDGLHAVDLDVLHEALQHVPLTDPVRDALIAFLTRLRERYSLDHTNSLLTDRTFLTRAPKLIRASAVVAGREAAHPDDLHVLKMMTTFRVPEEVQEAMDELIEEVASEARQRLEQEQDRGLGGGGSGGGGPPGGGGGSESKADAKPQPEAATSEEKTDTNPKHASPPPPPTKEEREEALRKAAAAGDVDEDENGRSVVAPMLDAFLRLLTPRPSKKAVETNVDAASVRGLLTLIGVLKGQFERHNHVTRSTHTDGVPRGWRRLRGLESFAEDAHPVDAQEWLRCTTADLPDAVRRAKPNRGGALAICRDVSTSMHGINAKYASSLALRLIELAQRRRMRVGVLEYSDSVHALRCGAQNGFFHQDYPTLRTFARRLECGGLTDYEAPLKLTLDEFASDKRLRSPYVPKHVLFITDGHPTKGDRRCVEARKRMRRTGVQLHTLFVEPHPGAVYPPLLAALADDSFGVRMRASVVDADAGIIDVSVVSPATDARVGANPRVSGWRAGAAKPLAHIDDHSLYPSLKNFFGVDGAAGAQQQQSAR